ncbi:hypothetical protein M3629_00610 [Paenibacillus polysaccharolyticus]|uniref:hypothetical protein n=1 Tax=Paenibacillus polysaccharolyticus TaxID=582692 RepID=UPI00203CEDF1|nr:hypothetical protein [Paenibacillus polysaccharolyticus]MCM3131265.1 hypothetical protein [Paenibacillus polysaccharolyticus]
MSERAEKKLKMQFGFIIIFIFIIGVQLIVKNYFVNDTPAWTTGLSISCFIIFCVLGLLTYLDLKNQEQFVTIGQIVDVKKDRNIIIVKGLGRGHQKILIKDSHILNMMQPDELIEITRLKYTKMITKKVYQYQDLQL